MNHDNKIDDMKNIPHLVCTAVLYIPTKDINYIYIQFRLNLGNQILFINYKQMLYKLGYFL